MIIDEKFTYDYRWSEALVVTKSCQPCIAICCLHKSAHSNPTSKYTIHSHILTPNSPALSHFPSEPSSQASSPTHREDEKRLSQKLPSSSNANRITLIAYKKHPDQDNVISIVMLSVTITVIKLHRFVLTFGKRRLRWSIWITRMASRRILTTESVPVDRECTEDL